MGNDIETFNTAFFISWKELMTLEEKLTIRDLYQCDFGEIMAYAAKLNDIVIKFPFFKDRSKNKCTNENKRMKDFYKSCVIDGIAMQSRRSDQTTFGININPKSPKFGIVLLKLKPEEIIINTSADVIQPRPPHGRIWKEVRHDRSSKWLAKWQRNGKPEYITYFNDRMTTQNTEVLSPPLQSAIQSMTKKTPTSINDAILQILRHFHRKKNGLHGSQLNILNIADTPLENIFNRKAILTTQLRRHINENTIHMYSAENPNNNNNNDDDTLPRDEITSSNEIPLVSLSPPSVTPPQEISLISLTPPPRLYPPEDFSSLPSTSQQFQSNQLYPTWYMGGVPTDSGDSVLDLTQSPLDLTQSPHPSTETTPTIDYESIRSVGMSYHLATDRRCQYCEFTATSEPEYDDHLWTHIITNHD